MKMKTEKTLNTNLQTFTEEVISVIDSHIVSQIPEGGDYEAQNLI